MYWEYFKNGGKLHESPHDLADLGGYTEKELYVDQIFSDYKQELLSHINMKTYKTLIQGKVQTLATSYKVKAKKASYQATVPWKELIKKGEPISKNHMTSLILYTDLSEYCSRFSSTFRQNTQYESLQSIKKRNGKYWWQSKYIREAVIFYGYDHGEWNKERGPFYSGVDMLLCLEGFSLRLRGPTSTSKHIEVALKFSKREGIIMSLNNTGYHFAEDLPFLDCSWFSAFADEVNYIIILFLYSLFCIDNYYVFE